MVVAVRGEDSLDGDPAWMSGASQMPITVEQSNQRQPRGDFRGLFDEEVAEDDADILCLQRHY